MKLLFQVFSLLLIYESKLFDYLTSVKDRIIDVYVNILKTLQMCLWKADAFWKRI